MKTIRCTAFGVYANKFRGREFIGVYVIREQLGKKNFTIQACHVTSFGIETKVSISSRVPCEQRQVYLKIVKGGAR